MAFDPSLDLSPTQQNELTSAATAEMTSRMAVTEGWQCVHPPSVKSPPTKQEAVFSQEGNQLFEIIILNVKVTSSGISAEVSRKTDPSHETALASSDVPADLSGIGQSRALEGQLVDPLATLRGVLAQAVDSAMHQAHPCGRWTGKIEFHLERTDESHSDLWDTSHHRLLDIVVTVTNDRRAEAHTHLDETSKSEVRIPARVNGAKALVRNSWQTVKTTGDGITTAVFSVSTVPEVKTFQVSLFVPPITAHKHSESGGRGHPDVAPLDVDLVVTWDGTTNITGTLDDPTHLHGKIPLRDLKNATTSEIAFEEWNLQWEK